MVRKKIVLIDALRQITEDLDRVFSEVTPNAQIVHMIDEGLVFFKDVYNKQVLRRFCRSTISAEELGASAILITCAHGLPHLKMLQSLVDPPVFQITMPMMEEAIKTGNRIGLVATESGIVDPIIKILTEEAQKAQKEIAIKVALCEAAFTARLEGNAEKFDELMRQAILNLAKEVDVIALAQVSSERIQPKAKDWVSIPILCPARIAAKKIGAILG